MATKSKKTMVNQSRIRLSDQQAAEKILTEIDNLLSADRLEEAMQTLDEAPARLQRLPEFSFARGQVLIAAGRLEDGITEMEEVIKTAPYFTEAYLALAITYAELDYWSHAQLHAEKLLRRKLEAPEIAEIAQKVIARAQAELSRKAAKVKVPLDKFVTASFANEAAQLYLHYGEYKRALNEVDKALRFTPGWTSPRNNRSMILFYTGQIGQAIIEAHKILDEIDADNFHALGNLILYYSCRWEPQQAAIYTDRLASLIRSSSLMDLDLVKAIESLGIGEDDQTLWELVPRVLGFPATALEGESWYVLGAAAANTGHFPEARRLLNRAIKNTPTFKQWLEPARKAVQKAIRENKPIAAPSLTGRLPYVHFIQVLAKSTGLELLDILTADYDKEEQMVELEKFVAHNPSAAYAGKLILWSEYEAPIRHVGAQLMAASRQVGAFQELRRFAGSQYGSGAERMHALGLLQLAGELKPDETIVFWSQEKGEWRDIQFYLNKIEASYRPPCSPRADKIVDQSNRLLEGNQEDRQKLKQAEELLRKAVAIDPKCAIATHNLGSVIARLGNMAEGEALMKKAVEIDPNYLFGYTSLAEFALNEENYDACQQYLDIIIKAPSAPANAMARALHIKTRLHLAQRELEGAKTSFEMLKAVFPDYPGIDDLEMIILIGDMPRTWQDRWTRDMHRYRDRQLNRLIALSDTLEACLDRNSAEALGYTLRFWGLQPRGRKAEIIQRLVDFLPDAEQLAWRFADLFDDQHKQALTWVLEGGGFRPWQEFTDRFGSDYDESPYWQYHDPETVAGVLRGSGLCFVGALHGERVIMIPVELRHGLGSLI